MSRRIFCMLAGGFLVVLTAFSTEASGLPSSLWEDLQVLDYRGSTSNFEAQREQAEPNTRKWAEATLGYAVCLHQRQPDVRGDKDKAGELYRSLSENPQIDDDIRALAHLFHGRLKQLVDYYKDEPDIQGAIEQYTALLQLTPGTFWADLAASYKAQCLIFSMDESQAREGVAFLTDWIEKRGEANVITAIQWLLIGNAEFKPLNDPVKALRAYENALTLGLDINRKLDDIYWRMANFAQEAGLTEKAITYYSKIIIDEPRSVFGYVSQERITKLGGTPPPLSDPFGETEGE